MGAHTRSLRRLTRAIWLVLVLNIVDALATLYWVVEGHATEGNPVMAHALTGGHGAFLLAKLTLVTLGCIVIWRGRKCVLAHVLFRVPLAAYAGVTVLHVAAAVAIL